MVFKRLPGRFGADDPTAPPAPAAGPARPGGPARGEARETQLTPAPTCAPAAGKIEANLSANPDGRNGVLKSERHGGLFAEGRTPSAKAEVEAWFRQVTGARAGGVAPSAATRKRAGGNGIAQTV